jgi:hypothetical protein
MLFMTISDVRFYFHPRRQRLERDLTMTHWGFAEWFKRRLKPLRDQLQGPEVKGVNIVNFTLHEQEQRAWRPNEWHRRLNTFEFSFICDLSPLREQAPIENIQKLMRFASTVSAQAPWPQMQAVSAALAAPLDENDRATLAPYLTWPRETTLRSLGYEGERLALFMEKARKEAVGPMMEARYAR